MQIKVFYLKPKLSQNRGSGIIPAIVARCILAVTVVMLTNGYLSTKKLTAWVEQKSALTPVLDSLLVSLAKASYYGPTSGEAPNEIVTPGQFISRLLATDGLHIPGGGKLVAFDATSAGLLLGPGAQDKVRICNDSTQAPLVPASKTVY